MSITKKAFTRLNKIVKNRIKELEKVAENNVILTEMLVEHKNTLKSLNSQKEWNYNFVGGGWNTAFGKHKEEAITYAKNRFPDMNTDETSFRIATNEETKKLLSLFY